MRVRAVCPIHLEVRLSRVGWWPYNLPGTEGRKMAELRDLTAVNPRAVLDEGFYDAVRASERGLKESFVVLPTSGRGFLVEKGQIFRLEQQTGPQVGEVAFWNAHNPKERFSAMRNRLFEGLFVTRNTRLWSDVPRLRPMMTCLEDTLATETDESPFHHHRFWTNCSAQSMEMRFGRPGMKSCQMSLCHAIEPFGLNQDDLKGNIVVFQKARFDTREGRWYGEPSDAKKGDYLEFYAEIDLLVAVSVCPNGNYPDDGDQALNPLGVEIYATGVTPREFPRWTDWRPGWTGKWVPCAGVDV